MSQGDPGPRPPDKASNFLLGALVFAILLLVSWRITGGILLAPLLAIAGTWSVFTLRK